MKYTIDELTAAKRQIDSTLHKLSIGVQGVQTRLKRNVRFESK